MFGAPDRGGGREGKKSLRKTKQNIDAKAKAIQKGQIPGSSSGQSETTATPPPVSHAAGQSKHLVDCGVQLINRQFDWDQLKVLQRASAEGVATLVAYTTDFEKADALARLSRENSSVIYSMVRERHHKVGVHTDMIKRSNEKLSLQRLNQLRELALRPETVALFAGLDFSRDVGIRYAQERALVEQMEIASALGLPMMLYQTAACEELADKIREFKQERSTQVTTGKMAAATPPLPRIAVYNFWGTEQELSSFLALGCLITVSGRVAAPGAEGEALREALKRSCPIERLLVCSDAPYCTPQNIDDAFMREGRNEPSNLPYLVKALQSVYGVQEIDLCRQLSANAFEFFGLQTKEQQDSSTRAAADAAHLNVLHEVQGGAKGLESTYAAEEATDGTLSVDEEAEVEEDGNEYVSPMPSSGNLFATVLHDNDSGDACTTDDESEAGHDPRASGAGYSGAVEVASTSSRQRPKPRPEFDSDKRLASRSYLLPGQDVSSQGPRVTFACRGCRSVLMCESDIRQHHAGSSDFGLADFKRGKGSKAKGNKGQCGGNDQNCSLHFLKAPLPWMLPSSVPLAVNYDTHMDVPTSISGQGIPLPNGDSASGQFQQEGRLACPCCGAKLGKFDMVDGLACSCGVEMPSPAFGILRARLDIKDAGLDLERVVQTSLRIYDGTQDNASSSDSGGSQQGKKKKKKKSSKGRGNTSNMGSFRNKDFGFATSGQPKQGKKLAIEQINETGENASN